MSGPLQGTQAITQSSQLRDGGQDERSVSNSLYTPDPIPGSGRKADVSGPGGPSPCLTQPEAIGRASYIICQAQ